MPRAKRPEQPQSQPNEKPFEVQDAIWNELVLMLRPLDRDHILAVRTAISEFVNSHRQRARHTRGVGPKRLKADIVPALKKVKAARRAIKRLTRHSLRLLWEEGLTPEETAALVQRLEQFEWRAVITVKGINKSMAREREKIRNGHLSKGDWSLRILVTDLFFLYSNLRKDRKKSSLRKGWNKFVSSILDAAGISHPGPGAHPERLITFLPMTIQLELGHRTKQSPR
jgi:hypothetical protein